MLASNLEMAFSCKGWLACEKLRGGGSIVSGRNPLLLMVGSSCSCHLLFRVPSSMLSNRLVGDGERSEVRGSLKRDCGDKGWRLTADESRLPRILLATGNVDRGVKKRPNLRGVTEGFRFSFRRSVRVGERRPLTAGDDMVGGGLDRKTSILLL